MKLVQATENTMMTFGGRKSSPESTMTQSNRSQPNQAPNSSTFGGMGQRLAKLCGAKGETDHEAANWTVSGSLEFVDMKNNTSNTTKGWASMSSNMAAVSGHQDSTHKVIDLGTAVMVDDVGDDLANDTLRTATEMEFAG
jgi:hypothetical protein